MNAKRIRDLRLERGLTQEQLAKIARVSQPSLSQYEIGAIVPGLKTAKRIASALGVSMEALINHEEESSDES